jgi:hypothetical protein
MISIFPISTSAFGLRGDWFDVFTPKMIRPAYLLVILFLVISVGVLALKRFEHANLEKKLWNLPVILIVIALWPALVVGIKTLVDTFNTFLIVDVFRIRWEGFGFPHVGSIGAAVSLPAEGMARLLPNIAYWVIYAFYLVFFFFFSILGPLVLAKGVLLDEMETFFDLIKEFVNLMLWQTTLIIIVAFLMPDMVSGQPLPAQPASNFYFLSFILGIMILFVPTVTRKFTVQIDSAFVPLGLRWGGGFLGVMAATRFTSAALAGAGVSMERIERLKPWRDRALRGEEFRDRYDRERESAELRADDRELERKLHQDYEQEQEAAKTFSEPQDNLAELSKRAEEEMQHNHREDK